MTPVTPFKIWACSQTDSVWVYSYEDTSSENSPGSKGLDLAPGLYWSYMDKSFFFIFNRWLQSWRIPIQWWWQTFPQTQEPRRQPVAASYDAKKRTANSEKTLHVLCEASLYVLSSEILQIIICALIVEERGKGHRKFNLVLIYRLIVWAMKTFRIKATLKEKSKRKHC